MLKVLIVDDEAIIREGMQSFPWESHGCRIAGLAEDGEEAILMTKLLSPDIIISDIQMPGLNGLQMAEKIKQLFPDISIVLLTGFDEIEYVRTALHLHVDEYLLKPADFQELGQTIDRIVHQRRIRQNRQNNYQKMYDQIQAALPVLRTNLFMQLANGHYVSEEEIANSFSLFDIPIGNYVVIGTSYSSNDSLNLARSMQENWMLCMTVTEACQDIFSNYTSDTLHFINNSSIYFLLIFSDQIQKSDCMNAVQLATHKIKKKLKNNLGIHLSFGISSMGTALMDIAELYYHAYTALTQCCFFNDTPTLYFDDIKDIALKDFFIPAAKRELFANAINTGNEEELEHYIDFILHAFVSGVNQDLNQYKFRIISEILFAIQLSNERHFIHILESGKHMEYINIFINCRTIHDLKIQALSFLRSITAGKHRSSASHYDQTAQAIIEYIQKHYHENISLDLLAEVFHFSPTYISRLIRRSQGTNFTEIVSETRLNEAKRLLADNSMRIADIGKQTGYLDTSYFIQSFKKRFGVTPNEYRNLLNM